MFFVRWNCLRTSGFSITRCSNIAGNWDLPCCRFPNPVWRQYFSYELAGSTERLTLTGCRGGLDRVQHAMARDRVVERRAQMRSLSIIAGETCVGLGDVGGRALGWRPPILLWHRQRLERRLRALAAPYGHLEDLGLAARGAELQIALGAVDLPEQVCAA